MTTAVTLSLYSNTGPRQTLQAPQFRMYCLYSVCLLVIRAKESARTSLTTRSVSSLLFLLSHSGKLPEKQRNPQSINKQFWFLFVAEALVVMTGGCHLSINKPKCKAWLHQKGKFCGRCFSEYNQRCIRTCHKLSVSVTVKKDCLKYSMFLKMHLIG